MTMKSKRPEGVDLAGTDKIEQSLATSADHIPEEGATPPHPANTAPEQIDASSHSGDENPTEDHQKIVARLKEAQRIANLGSWELDLTRNILTWSDEIYRIFEIDPTKFGASYEAFLDTIHPEDREAVNTAYTNSVATRTPYSIEHRLLFSDGRCKYVHEQCETFYDSEGRPLRSVGTVQDITERKRTEESLHRLNRELRAISNCNQTLMRATDERTLLNDICRIICDEAGYRLAWVGFVENDDDRSIRPVARAGFENGYLDQAKISWGDTVLGNGPSGNAIRSGRTHCIQDFAIDPPAAPWRKMALERGYRSSIALPLKDDKDKVFGILNIYSSEPATFTADEIRLLEELAADLAFGINVLRVRSEQRQAEQKINHLAAIVASSDDAIIGKTLEGIITSWNKGAEKIYGFSENEMIGKPISSLTPPGHPDEVPQLLARIKRGEYIDHYETLRQRKDGKIIHVALTISPIHNENGTIAAASSICRDITERKQLEQAIHARAHYARSLIEVSIDPLVTISPEGKITDVNQATETVTGVPRQQLIGSDFSGYFTEPAKARAGYRQVLDKGQVRDYPLTIRHVSGRETDVHYNASVYRDEAGVIQGVFAAARDITAQKQAEKERLAHLRFFESMNLVNRAIQTTSDPEQMMHDVLDVTLSIFDCDRAWLLYPCDPEAATWRVPVERTRPQYPGALAMGTEIPMTREAADLMRTVLQSDTPVRFDPESGHPLTPEEAKRFGYRSQISMALRPKTGKPWLFGLHQCSHPRVWQQREEQLFLEIGRRLADGLTSMLSYRELRENERFLNKIIENIPDMIFVKDADTLRFVRLNLAGEELLGYSREKMIGKNDYDLFPEEEAKFFTTKDREVLAKKVLVDIPEEPILTSAKGERIIRTKKIPILDEAGTPRYLLGISEDITEHRKMEEALKEKEAFIRNILETVDEGFIVVDREFRILAANRAYCRFVGLSEEAVVGQHCYEISHHVQTLCFESGTDCPVNNTFESGKPHMTSHVHKDGGEKHYLEIRSYPFTVTDGTVETAIETITDVTEKKKLEEQLRHAQKLESLGTLAGGVAHDFNNILTVIVGYSNMMAMRLAPDDPNSPYLREILAAAGRATNLTQALLIFSRKQIPELRPVDINELVNGMKKMVFRLIGEDIETDIRLASSPLVVMADYGQLEQVLMNFATNARDAMPDGGSLTIQTEHCVIDTHFKQHHGFGELGEYALISISDTGKGMDEATRDRIFEPFFTTKKVGKGTGLGLAIVYGIITQHNGFINCYSEPGMGTVFRVYLPLVNLAVLESGKAKAEAVRGGDETILIVDDDEYIRKYTRELLEKWGYTVLEAHDGVQAVQAYRENSDRIHLVLLDAVMPKKNGKEAFEEMKVIRSDAKALFVSGYSANVLEMKNLIIEGHPVLQKPVNPQDLLAKIRKMLDETRQEP